MSRFIVTGAAGFIGSHLSDRLLADGHAVLGLDSFTDFYGRALKDSNVRTAAALGSYDLAERDVLSLVDDDLDAVDGIFHLAAQAGVRGSWGDGFHRYLQDNVRATQHLFEIAARKRVRVVFASSSSVYGNAEFHPTPESARPRPVSPYGVTKLACESLAEAYVDQFDLDVVRLRYFTVYGPRQRPDMAFTRIARALQAGSAFTLFGDGTQTRDVTFVDDAVSATVRAMEAGRCGSVYNVGGGRMASLLDVIALFEDAAGRNLALAYSDVASGDVRHTGADTALAAAELSWFPASSIEAGIARQWSWAEETTRTALPEPPR